MEHISFVASVAKLSLNFMGRVDAQDALRNVNFDEVSYPGHDHHVAVIPGKKKSISVYRTRKGSIKKSHLSFRV